jgi:hypothetical protein
MHGRVRSIVRDRPAGDGTYELAVPLAECSLPLILPYSFPSEEDAALGSKKIE